MGWGSSEKVPEKIKMKRFVVFAMVPVWLSVGCVGPEQEVLDRYLDASQRGDNETVAALSMVAFPEDPESWNILEIGDERRDPYLVPELRQIVETAEDERDAQFKVFGEFRRENYETLRRIRARIIDQPDYHFPGRNGELQDQWEVFRLERRQVVAKLHEAEIALELEIRRVNKSLQRESFPEYLTGVALRKNARVRVTTDEGDEHYVITLTQYELKNQFDALVPARWIITEVAKAE
ncbi:MAG: hypothetical protein BMS9Abin37_0115 [Acidobacteriota bacterium]|nr:MAG: hypothetical protein BMS9Abin37_0115 [Acidobacteriota bacterium]